MEYRMAAAKDLPTLVEMRWENRQERSGESPTKMVDKADFIKVCQRFLEQAHESDRWYIWVAADDDELVAHIYIQIIEKVPRLSSFHPCFGYTTNVYTRPSWRGKGVGRKLMQAAIDWSKEEGLEMLVVWPSKESIEFYQRFGFAGQTDMMELHLSEYKP